MGTCIYEEVLFVEAVSQHFCYLMMLVKWEVAGDRCLGRDFMSC